MAPKILLVDDVNFFLELQKSYLSNVDCEIYTASNGKEALDKVSANKPDLIFVDYEMPVMNGLEFLREIKTNDEYKDIPTVVISAFIDMDLKKIIEEAGANKILKKPFSKEDFLSLVNEFLHFDKRKKTRVKMNIPAFYGFEDKMDKGLILDISEGGAFLEGDINLKEGAVLELKFLIPDTSKIIRTWAKIVWINDENNKKKVSYPKGAGLEFISMSKEDIQLLKTFLEKVRK